MISFKKNAIRKGHPSAPRRSPSPTPSADETSLTDFPKKKKQKKTKRKSAWTPAALPPRSSSAPPMVTRWSEKGPGLKILWIWTLGTAGSKQSRHIPQLSSLQSHIVPQTALWSDEFSSAVMITNVVRTRVNDMQKILQEEDEAAAAAAPMASGERVLKDDE